MNMNHENLERLRKLTPGLPIFSDFIKSGVHNKVDIDMVKGESNGLNVLWNEDIAVAKWFCAAGSIFPTHEHDEKELLIIYKGSMFLEIDGVEIYLGHQEHITIKPNTQHSSTFKEDCWFIAITLPASESFPHE